MTDQDLKDLEHLFDTSREGWDNVIDPYMYRMAEGGKKLIEEVKELQEKYRIARCQAGNIPAGY